MENQNYLKKNSNENYLNEKIIISSNYSNENKYEFFNYDFLIGLNLYQRKSFLYLLFVFVTFFVEIFCEIYLNVIKLENLKHLLELEEKVLKKIC
jgi:hypothetical protein